MHNSSTFRPPDPFRRPIAPRGSATPVALACAAIACWTLLVGAWARIVRLAPATAPVYAVLGLEANARPMSVDSVVSRLTEEEGRLILVVEGEIRNRATAPRAMSQLRLAVLDANGREIYSWTAAPPKSRLRGGETASFRARLAAPPAEGREVRVRFAAKAERRGQGS